MAHPLDGVRAKLNRATKHRRELNAKVRAFLASESYRVVLEPDGDPKYQGWYLGVFRVFLNPPLDFGVIAGEVFGQYRSALDHLMTQLMVLRRTEGANFPIYPRGDFWVQRRRNKPIPADRIRPLVRPEHFALLERLQEPKNTPPSNPISTRALLTTQWFSNMDKHELVQPGFFAVRQVGVSFQDHLAGFEFIWEPPDLLDNGTKLYRVRFVSEEQMEVPFRLQPDLTFGGSPNSWLPVDRIAAIGRQVRRIVQRFVEITPEFR